jgi:hypothetical protein
MVTVNHIIGKLAKGRDKQEHFGDAAFFEPPALAFIPGVLAPGEADCHEPKSEMRKPAQAG